MYHDTPNDQPFPTPTPPPTPPTPTGPPPPPTPPTPTGPPLPPTQGGKGLFDAIPSKTAFIAGLIGGIMSFSTLGFVLILTGSIDLGNAGKTKIAAVENTNTAPVAPSPTPQPDPVGTVIPVGADDHVRGDLNKADVVLIEYSDYECPFCKRFHPTTQEVLKFYGDKVALVYRHFPLSFHVNAQKEAEASECVAELGGNDAFWKFTDVIFERTEAGGTGFALAALPALAKEIGVSESKFKTCLDSGKFAQKVKDQMSGGEAAGISGTPGTIALGKNGVTQMISGAQPIDAVKATIDSMLQ